MKIQVKFRCIDGGHGWGETGSTCNIIDEGKDFPQAWNTVMKQIPGGWEWYEVQRVANTEIPGIEV